MHFLNFFSRVFHVCVCVHAHTLRAHTHTYIYTHTQCMCTHNTQHTHTDTRARAHTHTRTHGRHGKKSKQNACVCIYIYTHTHTCMFFCYIHTCILFVLFPCACVCLCVCVCVCARACRSALQILICLFGGKHWKKNIRGHEREDCCCRLKLLLLGRAHDGTTMVLKLRGRKAAKTQEEQIFEGAYVVSGRRASSAQLRRNALVRSLVMKHRYKLVLLYMQGSVCVYSPKVCVGPRKTGSLPECFNHFASGDASNQRRSRIRRFKLPAFHEGLSHKILLP